MSLLPFDDRDGVIWFDGALVPWRDAKIHVLSHGLHYGSCVFEGERAYGGAVFKLTEHSKRLVTSAQLLGFDLPYTVEELDRATEAVIAGNGIVDGYVRPVAWRGSEMMGVSARNSKIHTAIATWQWPAYFSPEARMRGIRMCVSKWARPAPNTAPTASKAAGLYMICTLSKHAAENDGYDDALMLDWQGLIAEATGANVFLVIDGEVHTPKPDAFLDGITRRTVIDLARAHGLTVVERSIPPDDLARVSEVFITGTAAEVTPVREIGPHHYQPGRISRLMMDAYDALVRQKPQVNGRAA
ncbi:MAG TPA: branched-chain amino acid aminotransferase [Stellaceae bacterium]|nr:branched-chain amino acid aminotransferase [Stellaceae bacterium]